MTLVLAWMLVLLAGLPVAILALECLVGSLAAGPGAARAATDADAPCPPPILVLMPAHQEEAQITRTVQAVMAQLRPCDMLLVVADNCTDGTARIARGLGAMVAERVDPGCRGKPFALEFARALIAADPVFAAAQVVVVLDADCILTAGSLRLLAARSAAAGAAVQGAYLLEPHAGASAVVRASCFAFLLKNLVREAALQRLSGTAMLLGSGMAFPRRMFLAARWSTDTLAEDLAQGINLLLSGEAVLFEPRARVLSPASSKAGTVGQRRRWEHGSLLLMGRFVPRLLRAALAGRPRLLFAALDMMVPPTVLLGAVSAIALALVWGLAWGSLPALVLLGLNLAALGGISLAWWMHGRIMLPPASLLAAARYLPFKLPILLQFVTRRERHWLRSERRS